MFIQVVLVPAAIIGVLLLLIVLWRGHTYSRIFSRDHILAFGKALSSQRKAAAATIMKGNEGHPGGPDDPRLVLTDAGLAFAYTVSANTPGEFVHHASLSLGGGRAPAAVGQTFILYWAYLLDVPLEKLALGVADSGVHHAEFRLSQDQHDKFAAAEVPERTDDLLAELFAKSMDSRPSFQWQRIQTAVR